MFKILEGCSTSASKVLLVDPAPRFPRENGQCSTSKDLDVVLTVKACKHNMSSLLCTWLNHYTHIDGETVAGISVTVVG